MISVFMSILSLSVSNTCLTFEVTVHKNITIFNFLSYMLDYFGLAVSVIVIFQNESNLIFVLGQIYLYTIRNAFLELKNASLRKLTLHDE